MDLKSILKRVLRRGQAPAKPQRTAESLRQLYFNHQKQKRHWAFIVLSALMLMCLFIVMSLFTKPNLWVIGIPFAVIVYSFFQIRRCGNLARMLRQALAVQSQIDKAQREAEEKAKAGEEERAAAEAKEAEAAERAKPVIEALSGRGPAEAGGANGAGKKPKDRPELTEEDEEDEAE
jgi:hypothetical protein